MQKYKYRLGALAAAGLLAGGLSVGSASAADLGGDCCADLEERVAELEATTARKGNRKVSLTVSGWVAEQVMWWDDGVEQNAYVTGVGATLSSHFKFTGEAKINSDVSAGYVLHLEVRTSDPLVGQTQATDEAGNGVAVFQSFWYLKSNTLGKFSVGQQSHAADNTAILVDGSGSLVQANWVMFEGRQFFTRNNGAFNGRQWSDYGHCWTISAGIGGDCNGNTNNVVRYDTPSFGGFSASASWGEDDMWAVAARYAGEFVGFKLAAAAAYSESNDISLFAAGIPGQDISYFQAGAYIQHVATGLFVYGAYGRENVDGIVLPVGIEDNPDHWYVKAGIRQRWTPLGHTVLYGEYGRHNDQLSPVAIGAGVTSAELNRWGVGVVQEIDAAAMSVWLKYRQFEGEENFGAVSVDLDKLHMVTFGALISF